MSDLLKFLARHLVLGITAGWITLGVLLASNTAGLRDIVFASSQPLLPLALLFFGFTITFGSIAMGAAIMMMPYRHSGGGPRGAGAVSLRGLLHWLGGRSGRRIAVRVTSRHH